MNTRILFVGIAFLAVFFRFLHIMDTPPGLYPDEAMNGTNALQALENNDFLPYYIDNNGREGLFINLQALAIWFFGNEAWVLRIVSAIFGVLAVCGIFLLTKELFQNSQNHESRIKNQGKKEKIHTSYFIIHNSEKIALLSSFFLATSYWHITLSRIGFRAITTPTFSIFAFFFLLRGMRRGSMGDFALSGIMLGLGLNGYIAFRFFPFAFAIPILIGLWHWWKTRPIFEKTDTSTSSCLPCGIVLVGIFTIAICAPLIIYFGTHMEDFAARTGQVSIFADEHPLRAFAISNIKTVGMLFIIGDCNSRHNFPCLPALHPIVAIAFLYGLWIMVQRIRAPDTETILPETTLIAWLFFLSLPATLTREGMPHALRSIGMIPPVMIIAAFGAYMLWEKLGNIWNKRLLLIIIPLTTAFLYFGIWAKAPSTASAFSQDLSDLANYMRSLPPSTVKYLIVNLDHEGLPVSAQSVVYLTNTATTKTQKDQNVTYLPRLNPARRITIGTQPTIIGFVAFHDTALEQELEQAFPMLIKERQDGFTVYSYKP